MSDFEQNESSALTKLRPWLLGAGVVVALGGLYYFLATRGPRAVDASLGVVTRADDEALRKLSGDVAQAEAVWRAEEAAGRGNSPEARAALALAVEKQRALVRRDPRALPAESEKLRRLEQRVADADVREKLDEVAALEKAAAAAREDGRAAEAVATLKAALEILQAVNRSEASAALKDLPRESRLKLDVEIAEAEPLSRQVMEARAKAERAAQEERWDEVREAFKELLAVQSRINREYPRTPFVDTAAEGRAEGRIQTLQASSLAHEVRGKAGGGVENMRAGRYEQAARLFAQAAAAQEKINTHFPKSDQYSVSGLEHLEASRQTALSMEGLASARALDAEATALLKAGDLAGAQKKIADAAKVIGAVWRDFPRSEALDEGLRERVNYRAAKSGALTAVHAAVFPELKALGAAATAEAGAVRMAGRETTQGLYALIADRNPSRTTGQGRPVDSVNWAEAREFCRRLGWLLGRTVRLPTEAEYRAAAATGGFTDLTGGVAEWLEAGEAEAVAPLAGGSYLDKAETLPAVAVERVAKAERARHVGFRFVVE